MTAAELEQLRLRVAFHEERAKRQFRKLAELRNRYEAQQLVVDGACRALVSAQEEYEAARQ